MRRTSFLKFGIGGKDTESRDYEDVLSADILNAPISDICIVQSGEVNTAARMIDITSTKIQSCLYS